VEEGIIFNRIFWLIFYVRKGWKSQKFSIYLVFMIEVSCKCLLGIVSHRGGKCDERDDLLVSRDVKYLDFYYLYKYQIPQIVKPKYLYKYQIVFSNVPRCLDGDDTVMAMRRQPCKWINRHLEATPD